jgi:hypothetical protein
MNMHVTAFPPRDFCLRPNKPRPSSIYSTSQPHLYYLNNFANMAVAAENSVLFQELQAEGKRIVQGGKVPTYSLTHSLISRLDPPKLDLESYISNYDGKSILQS